jgi:hypothetical protein
MELKCDHHNCRIIDFCVSYLLVEIPIASYLPRIKHNTTVAMFVVFYMRRFTSTTRDRNKMMIFWNVSSLSRTYLKWAYPISQIPLSLLSSFSRSWDWVGSTRVVASSVFLLSESAARWLLLLEPYSSKCWKTLGKYFRFMYSSVIVAKRVKRRLL